jgi:hypothetical protein
MINFDEVSDLTHVFGEEWKLLITDALQWLDENESSWNLNVKIDRYYFLLNLIDQVKGCCE